MMEKTVSMSAEDTEASVKLVEDSGPKAEILSPTVDAPKNGETKITISEVKQAFVGMGKEELMKFANDPFWVKLRWFLFVLFWFLWFGMLFGAIAIIVLAPKCNSSSSDWYLTPTYSLTLEKNIEPVEGSAFDGLVTHTKYFKELGIKSVIIGDVIKHTEEGPDHVTDFMAADPRHGSLDSLKTALGKLKDDGIHVFLRIVPNHVSKTHEWFQKSVTGEAPFKDYFVWASSSTSDAPNNWVSTVNNSAWTFDSTRKEFYLHQFNESLPDLNFRNKDIQHYFSDVYKFWLNVGFSGIHLEKVGFLIEDEGLEDESINPASSSFIKNYDFFYHTKTLDLDETYDLLKLWHEVISKAAGIFSVSGVSDKFDFAQADVVQRPFRGALSPETLKAYIKLNLERNRQTWNWEDEKLDEPSATALQMLWMLLPGNYIIHAGVELGSSPGSKFILPKDVPEFAGESQDKSTITAKSHSFTNFKRVMKLKKEEVAVRESNHASDTSLEIINGTIFTLFRTKAEEPGYVMAFNMGTEAKTLDLMMLKKKEFNETVRIIAASSSIQSAAETPKILTVNPKSFFISEFNQN